MKANSTRPALLFTNNGNVKLTAHPAIDTSAGRDSLFLRVENFPESACFSLSDDRPPRCRAPSHPCLFPVSRSPRQLLFLVRSLFPTLAFPLPFTLCIEMQLGVRCTFIIALLSQVCVLFSNRKKQAKRGRRAMNEGLDGERRARL